MKLLLVLFLFISITGKSQKVKVDEENGYEKHIYYKFVVSPWNSKEEVPDSIVFFKRGKRTKSLDYSKVNEKAFNGKQTYSCDSFQTTNPTDAIQLLIPREFHNEERWWKTHWKIDNFFTKREVSGSFDSRYFDGKVKESSYSITGEFKDGRYVFEVYERYISGGTYGRGIVEMTETKEGSGVYTLEFKGKKKRRRKKYKLLWTGDYCFKFIKQ